MKILIVILSHLALWTWSRKSSTAGLEVILPST